MSLKLPSDWMKRIAETLNISEKKVEDYFEIGEDKQGYFYAKRKKSKWLEQTEFKTMCSLSRDYNGEYIKEQQLWRVPGPFAKKTKQPTTGTPVVESPQAKGSQDKAESPKEPQKVEKSQISSMSEITDVRSIPLATVPVKDLLSMPFVSRTTDDPQLSELVESMKTYGVLEPIVVRPKPSGAFEVVAGARRLRGAKEAGLTDIPVVIKPLSDPEAYEVQLIENVQRKDLADIEKARMLDYMIKQFGYLQKDLAKKLGKSEAWISNHLAMLKLKQLYPGKVNEAKITEKQAREILSASPEKREEIIKQVAETGEVPSSREIHRAVYPEPEVTTTIPSTESVPEAPTPKPEEKDVGEFECPLCHFKARIAHADPNKHKFVPYSEESLSQ